MDTWVQCTAFSFSAHALTMCVCRATSQYCSIAVPCDLVKVQMMTDVTGTRYAGTLSAFRDIFRREGLAGMWRGTVPTCSRAAVGAMTELPVYDEIKTRLIADEYFTDGFQLHAVSALCAGLVSTFAMNPFDVAKSRVCCACSVLYLYTAFRENFASAH